MASRSGTTANISLSIVNQKTGQPVSYKQDGKRFALDLTVKLSVDAIYSVAVTVKPEFSKLKKLEIGSDSLTPEESTSSDGSVRHKLLWHTTGIAPSGSAKRSSLLFTFHFESGTLTHVLQAKFYKAVDTQHVTWGTSVNSINLTCSLDGDGSSVGKVTDSRIL